MVRIAEQVWVAWREQIAQGHEPTLLLLLAPVAGADVARALRESVLEVQDAYQAEAERARESEPPSIGEWDWVRVSDGVLVQVVEGDALESVLPAIAGALERRGIEGIFKLREHASVAARPRIA